MEGAASPQLGGCALAVLLLRQNIRAIPDEFAILQFPARYSPPRCSARSKRAWHVEPVHATATLTSHGTQ